MNVKGGNPELVFTASLQEKRKLSDQPTNQPATISAILVRTFNPKILSSSIRTPSYRYSARVTISTYGNDDRTSSLNTDPASSTLSSTLSIIRFPFERTSLQSRCCCCGR